MPGPVSAWMGDRLRMDIPPRRRHRGLLSLSNLSVGMRNEYLAKVGRLNRTSRYSPYPWSHSVGWCLAEGLANGDRRRRTESGSTLEACSR